MAGVIFLLGLAACNTVLPAFVGDRRAQPATGATSVPALPNTAYAPQNLDALAPQLGPTQNILPPTIPADPNANPPPPPVTVGSEGPRKPIAVAPLSADPARLSPLRVAAAQAVAQSADTRFVLLVLMPQAADSAALAKNNADSQAAADSAVKLLGLAGIDADRVTVSAATNPDAGAGEIRLYRR